MQNPDTSFVILTKEILSFWSVFQGWLLESFQLVVNSLLQVELEQRIHVHIVTHVLKVDWQESLYLIALIYIS